MADLSGSRVLMIATNGFEDSELRKPLEALKAAGATVVLASLSVDPIVGESGGEKCAPITPDASVDTIEPDAFDALVLPGGVANPDTLRMNDRVVEIVEDMFDAEKIVAAICHAPWLLVEADILDGREATSWPSLRTDLENAGAIVLDQPVVIDDNLITSRNPDDIPAFIEAIVTALAEVQLRLPAGAAAD